MILSVNLPLFNSCEMFLILWLILKALFYEGYNKVGCKYTLIACFNRTLGQPTNLLLRSTCNLLYSLQSVQCCLLQKDTHTHIYTSRKKNQKCTEMTNFNTIRNSKICQQTPTYSSMQPTLQRNFSSSTCCIQFRSVTEVPVSWATSVTTCRSIFSGLCNISSC